MFNNCFFNIFPMMIRQHLNETQAQFAERFGLTRDDVSNYELERCEPPLQLLDLMFRISTLPQGEFLLVLDYRL